MFTEDSRLEVIGAGCFRESGLERIEIPASVIAIDKLVFYGCTRLKIISFQTNN